MSYALGKAPAKFDHRNLKMGALLSAASPPASYDCDKGRPVPMPMFANDRLGCCVISGRAHQTLRFELRETSLLPAISDDDVQREYFAQTGGVDSGLVVLDSLKLWRKQGWQAAGNTYRIRGFAEINPRSRDEVKRSIYADVGVGVGLNLPASAEGQHARRTTWSVLKGPKAQPGSWGGHYVYVVAYNGTGPVCVTWGRRQQMTWNFWATYCDEAYGIFDERNLLSAAINGAAVTNFLASLEQPATQGAQP